MKKILFFAAGGVMLCASCTITRKTLPTAPLNVQVNFNMDDLEFVGEVTGTATQYSVLGIPYGGRKYYVGLITSQTNLFQFQPSRAMNNALYDALLSRPNADFILPISIEEKEQKVFLGKKRTVSVRGKAFRIKTK